LLDYFLQFFTIHLIKIILNFHFLPPGLLLMTKEQDKYLVERIQTGTDPKAEAELFARFDARIVRQVRYRLGKDNNDCDDVINDSKMAILIALREGKFDVSRGVPLGSYIYAITTNKIRDYYKYYYKQKETANELAKDSVIKLDEGADLERKELQDVMRNFLSSLDTKYQEVLYLKYYDDLSISKISKQLNLPPKKVSERIHYALKLLKKKCKKEKFLSIFWAFFIIII